MKDDKKNQKRPKISEAEECPDYEAMYKRALADYQNLVKQFSEEKKELVRFANAGLLEEIIPVYDNFKIALRHVCSSDEKLSSVDEGLKYVMKQFKEVLEKAGVEEIEVVGRTFDHTIMDAMEKRSTKDKDSDGKVAEEIKPGYKLNGKVLTHAKVAVWDYKKDEENENKLS